MSLLRVPRTSYTANPHVPLFYRPLLRMPVLCIAATSYDDTPFALICTYSMWRVQSNRNPVYMAIWYPTPCDTYNLCIRLIIQKV